MIKIIWKDYRGDPLQYLSLSWVLNVEKVTPGGPKGVKGSPVMDTTYRKELWISVLGSSVAVVLLIVDFFFLFVTKKENFVYGKVVRFLLTPLPKRAPIYLTYILKLCKDMFDEHKSSFVFEYRHYGLRNRSKHILKIVT